MSTISTEQTKIFKRIKHLLGAPLRKIEITDEMFCSLLEIAIEDYAQYVQDWLIEHQWPSLLGQNIDNIDIAFALTTRSLDFETQFTYAYSKQVGLQARGPWILKKDSIDIEKGKQIYEIPAGREVNEVLWVTPPSIDHALFSYYGFGDYGFGGGQAQVPFAGQGGGGNLGYGGYYIAPAYDVLLRAADYNLKHRVLRSELTYKITAGDNGTKLLHLLSTPGSNMSFGMGGGRGNNISLVGCKVWYHYYDTTGEDKEACLQANKDIVKLPNDVPLDEIKYEDLNEPTKIWVRQYLTALAKESLGRVRGKFGGTLKIPDAELTMDYDSLLNEAKDEKEKLLTKLEERLQRLSSENQLERKANESEHLNRSLGYRPLGFYII